MLVDVGIDQRGILIRGAICHVQHDATQRHLAALQLAQVILKAAVVRMPSEELLVDLVDACGIVQPAIQLLGLGGVGKGIDHAAQVALFLVQSGAPVRQPADIGRAAVIGQVGLFDHCIVLFCAHRTPPSVVMNNQSIS